MKVFTKIKSVQAPPTIFCEQSNIYKTLHSFALLLLESEFHIDNQQ